jgi:hypothetical protein
MKTIKSKFLVLSLILFTAIAFSSCDKDDYELKLAELTYEATIPVPPNGAIFPPHNIDLGYQWIKVVGGGSYDRIDDLRYLEGSIEIFSGPHIEGLKFILENSNVTLTVPLNSRKGAFLDDTDPAVRVFLKEVVYLIRDTGYARVGVTGQTTTEGSVEFDILIDMEARVWY